MTSPHLRPLLTATLVAFLTAAALPADEVRLDYKKAARGERPSTRPAVPPSAPSPPDELVVTVPTDDAAPTASRESDDKSRRWDGRGDRDGRGHGHDDHGDTPPSPPDDEVARMALQAASDQAGRALASGRRQAFEVGFYRGMRRAVDDSSLAFGARFAGERDGRTDPGARRRGETEGQNAAASAAAASAEEDVRAQFADLDVEPSIRPRPVVPRYAGGAIGLATPELDDVFRDLEPAVRLSAEPWALYRVSSSHQVGDDRWRDADQALRDWLDDRRRRAAFQSLAEADQRRFRELFSRRFYGHLARSQDELYRAHARGFDAGWDYGASVREEHEWRLGYRDGYAQAYTEGTERGWADAYPRIYRDAYTTEFERWSTQPHPALHDLVAEDADDDGVFSPGEALRLRYTVVNYGGGSGRLAVHLDAPELEAPIDVPIFLPRRRATEGEPLVARFERRVPPRTIADLVVRVGDAEARLPIRVAYPLELDRSVELRDHDTLAGRATLAVTLANHSRREVPASVVASADGLPEVSSREPLDRLRPGTSRRLTFDLEGIRPLDILAGRSRVEIVANSGRDVHDTVEYRFPIFALDLASPDLHQVLLALARDPDPSREEVREVHRLVLEQLRRDYEVAAQRDGNPYRTDRGDAAPTTALGRLVAAYQRERPTLRRPEVVTALRGQIDDLTESLPGLHPFLKSQMRKLAKELR